MRLFGYCSKLLNSVPANTAMSVISIMSDASVVMNKPKLVLGLAWNLTNWPSEGRGQKFESSRVRHFICHYEWTHKER